MFALWMEGINAGHIACLLEGGSDTLLSVFDTLMGVLDTHSVLLDTLLTEGGG